MDFELTDEQVILRDTLRRFAGDRHGAEQRRASRKLPQGFAAGNRDMLSDLGVFALPVPESHGGLGGGLADVIVVMEALGHGLVVDPVLVPAMLAVPLLASVGDPAMLAEILDGGGLITLAHRDAAGQRTRIDAEDRLSGAKQFVPHADAASSFLVTCGDGALCLIAANAPGVTREDSRLIDGSTISTIRFDAVPVQAGDRFILPPNVLAAALRRAAVAASAEMLGILQRMFETTLNYVNTRRQFGTAVGTFQAVRHRMARMFIRIEQARSLVLKAALMPADDPDWPHAVAACRLYLSEAALEVAHGCVQLHGGMGITDELDITEGHRRLLVLRRLFDTDGPYPLPPADLPLTKAA